MKNYLFTLLAFAGMLFWFNNSYGQCSFVSPTVDILNIVPENSGTQCRVDFNLAFDIEVNNGNKVIFIHLWEQANYPTLNYNCNHCHPMAADLAATIANFVINDFGPTPILESVYAPDPTVPVLSNSSMTVTRGASTTAGATRFYINNISVLLNSACNLGYALVGDAWSSNSNTSEALVHCAMTGITIGTNEIAVTGNIYCGDTRPNLRKYEFQITTTAASSTVFYNVYLDDGDSVPEPAQDYLINSVTIDRAFDITPTTPFVSRILDYPAPYYDNVLYASNKIFIIVGKTGVSYAAMETLDPVANCRLLPMQLGSFNAARNEKYVELKWNTLMEQNADRFDIEMKSDNSSPFLLVDKVKAVNSKIGNAYTYNHFNSSTNKSFYRLRMVDLDGKFTYSNVVPVAGYGSKDLNFDIVPNPSGSNVQVKYFNVGSGSLQLLNPAGLVQNSVTISGEGTAVISGVRPGIYFVRLISSRTNESVVKKLVVSF